MDPAELKRSLRAGIQRSRGDGIFTWDRSVAAKMIWLPDSKPNLADEAVQRVLEELRDDGEIEIPGRNDAYIQIQPHPRPLWPRVCL